MILQKRIGLGCLALGIALLLSWVWDWRGAQRRNLMAPVQSAIRRMRTAACFVIC